MRVPLCGISILRQRVSTVALNGQTEVILSVMEDAEEKYSQFVLSLRDPSWTFTVCTLKQLASANMWS